LSICLVVDIVESDGFSVPDFLRRQQVGHNGVHGLS
jgi:hypothetical protein